MDLSWLQCVLYSLISGLADILPVSAEAHKVLLYKIYGVKADATVFLDLLIHIGVLGGLYFSNLAHLTRISKARHLARIPKRRRRRPLDTRSLMDFSMLKTMAIPVILSLLLLPKVSHLENNLMILAGFLLLNGIILYIPQFLPGSNRDARTLSPLAGLAIGMGGAVSILPGISCVGSAISIASVRGADKHFSLNTALLMTIPVTIGLIAMDIFAIVEVGLAGIGFVLVLKSLISAVAAFFGVRLGIHILRLLVENIGFSVFAPYCWGIGLFTFIFYLTAA